MAAQRNILFRTFRIYNTVNQLEKHMNEFYSGPCFRSSFFALFLLEYIVYTANNIAMLFLVSSHK